MMSQKPTDAGNFSKFLIPMIKRVYLQTVAQDLLSVQPMSSPLGGVFYENMYGVDLSPMEIMVLNAVPDGERLDAVVNHMLDNYEHGKTFGTVNRLAEEFGFDKEELKERISQLQ